MRRREFVTLVGGAAAWPFLVGAQGNPIRRLGVVMNYAETDAEAKRFLAAFTEKLAELGWIGRPQSSNGCSLGSGQRRPDACLRKGAGRASS